MQLLDAAFLAEGCWSPDTTLNQPRSSLAWCAGYAVTQNLKLYPDPLKDQKMDLSKLNPSRTWTNHATVERFHVSGSVGASGCDLY